MQVRLNLESKGHSVKVTGISGAEGKIADFPEVLLDALYITTRIGTACFNLNSSEGKPTTGEGSRVRNLLPQPLHHIDLDEFVPKVRDLHVQAHGVSGAKFSGKLRGHSLGQGARQEKSGVRWRGKAQLRLHHGMGASRNSPRWCGSFSACGWCGLWPSSSGTPRSRKPAPPLGEMADEGH